MKILFTGASSFSGMWFVQELAKGGHEVTAAFRQPYESYQEVRLQRIEQVRPVCRPVFNCPFGSPAFLDLIKSTSCWDLLCHHASDVHNYKSPDFDFAEALANNTHNVKSVLEILKKHHCQKVLLTGSVFEQREGFGTEGLRAVSPYGLSKGLTADVFAYYTAVLEMKLGKFVIPNPFGPYEEMRFTSYLAQTWCQGKSAPVNTPEYIRDNIPVSLLAKAYADFAGRLGPEPGFQKLAPSYIPETQGNFTARFAHEMCSRLSLPCEFILHKQTDFSEPRVRINTDKLDISTLGWDPAEAWDELAEYYQQVFQALAAT